MEKQIITFSIAGVLVSSKPWKEAHEMGMRELAEKSGLPEFTGEGNYFEWVEKALEKIYPDLSPEERTTKRRKIYFERVLNNLKRNFDINQQILDLIEKLKSEYSIGIITTNNEFMTNEVLGLLGAKSLFDFIEFSKDEEKDDKKTVFERFIQKHGLPKALIENNEKLKQFCEEKGIKHIRFDIDTDSVEELEKQINS